MTTESPPPVPSATVVPLRDGRDGLEVLMIERAAGMRFGGMWAFPGGRIDPGDGGGATGGHDDPLEVARRAAVREAEEEVGLRFAPEALVPLSHWTGGGGPGRRFAAWYFVAPAPPGTVLVDGSETVAHRWIAPSEALARRDRGEMPLVAPTWMTLVTLTGARTAAEVLARARTSPPAVYESRLALDGDRRIVLWQDDAGYAAGDPRRPGPRHRLVMDDAGWTLERG